MFVIFFHLCPSLNVSCVAVSAVSPFLRFSFSRFLMVSHLFCTACVPRFFVSPFTGVCVSSLRCVAVSPCISFHISRFSIVRRFIYSSFMLFSVSLFHSRMFFFSRVSFSFLRRCFVSPVFLFPLLLRSSLRVSSVLSSSFSKWRRSFFPCFLRVVLKPCERGNRKITSTPDRRKNESEVVLPRPPPIHHTPTYPPHTYAPSAVTSLMVCRSHAPVHMPSSRERMKATGKAS